VRRTSNVIARSATTKQSSEKNVRKRVYLDYAASAPLLPEVSVEMTLTMRLFGNPSSLHTAGREAKAAIERAREAVAAAIGAKPSEIIFTSSGTESNNAVINSFDHVIVSAIEHPSISRISYKVGPCKKGFHVIDVDRSGKIDIQQLTELLNKTGDNTLVSVQIANNEIGTIQNISEIVKIAHAAGAKVHTDAVQALGKILIDVDKLGVDYMTLSAHKIGGPKGVGALYVRDGQKLQPLICGGHQEQNRRAATENTIGIVGFGAAAKQVPNLIKKYQSQVKLLRDRLRDFCEREFSHISVNTPKADALPNILSISFAGVEGESILLALDNVGIEVSTGSACASGDIRSSHVLTAINTDPELAHGSIRFSLGPDTTKADIDYVFEQLPPTLAKLRGMSTVTLPVIAHHPHPTSHAVEFRDEESSSVISESPLVPAFENHNQDTSSGNSKRTRRGGVGACTASLNNYLTAYNLELKAAKQPQGASDD